jgi:hypothetical protein
MRMISLGDLGNGNMYENARNCFTNKCHLYFNYNLHLSTLMLVANYATHVESSEAPTVDDDLK